LHVILAKDVFLGSWAELVREGHQIEGDLLMTPRIREAMRSTICGFEGFFDLMRIAVLDTTVSMGFKPAAFIVSPDSRNCQ